MAFLYRIQTDGSPAEGWALEDEPVVVGQGESVDAYVEDDALSHSHFLIVREETDFLLVDLRSSNGTWVNGRRVSAHKLQPNEFIQAGRSLFCFVEPAVAGYAGVAAMPWLASSQPSSELPRAA